MHNRARQIEGRIRRLHDQRIWPAEYADRVPLTVAMWRVPDRLAPPPAFADAVRAPFGPVEPGTAWGIPWQTTWFRITGTVPAGWPDDAPVEALVDLGYSGGPGFTCEALVWSATGEPLKGIHPRSPYIPVPAGAREVHWYVEASATPDVFSENLGNNPNSDILTAREDPIYRLGAVDLALRDLAVYDFAMDVNVLQSLMHALPENDSRRHEIRAALERAMDTLDLADISGTSARARAELTDVMNRPAVPSAHRVSAVGHAHIDTAWLWPLRETERKVGRTYANALTLMEEHEDFVFAGPQAQHYAWLKERYPATWRRLQDAVRRGQWAPVGGMWVEADGNLPGGEALARQLIHGKRFFADELGVETRGVWLPDSFGYSAAYPQLARLAGNDWFLTQKISWNQTNTFPHHTFWWEGIDGTRIFTHFPPTDTYNGSFQAGELVAGVQRYREKGGGASSLYPFGFGDGGGGPTRGMVERARRLADLEGAQRVVMEHPDAFFDRARAEYPDAPVWRGELYLELHRGTYTSQARCKQGNRFSEALLAEVEAWCTTAAVTRGWPYPYEQLDSLWKQVLTLQFHDILPGSSIGWVHREAEESYSRILAELESLAAQAVQAAAGAGDVPLLANPSPIRRQGVPSRGLAAAEPPAPPRVRTESDTWVLADHRLRITVDSRGLVTSMMDLTRNRDLVAPGQAANLLQLHPDLPNFWDAWDVDEHYRHTHRDLIEVMSLEVIDDGSALRVRREFGASWIEQSLSLGTDGERSWLQVDTTIDWQEREKFLKVAFPLDIASDEERSEIQFGHVRRATHENTSWDAARFEASHQRWFHMSEYGWGATLATDSSYGHDVRRTVSDDGRVVTTARLSLLRAPNAPDPTADRGLHTFSYAIAPGTLADAPHLGYALARPLRAVTGAGPMEPLVSVNVEPGGGDVYLETLKLADDRSGDVVVRLYEALGGRTTFTLISPRAIHTVTPTDLLERPLPSSSTQPPDARGDARTFTLRPFEILTLRIRFGTEQR